MLPLLACAPADDDDGNDPSRDTSGLTQESGTQDEGRAEGHYFPDGAPWYQDVTDAAVDPSSDLVIGALQDAGWGMGRMQIDFSMEILQADADTPRMAFEPTVDFYSPDCDLEDVPIPDDGNVEGEEGYRCASGGDCHLLVAEQDEGRLYEMWKADIVGEDFQGGCMAAWDMERVYGEDGRGDQCTSADAAGYPISPLLFTADEVASGAVDHAIRFILPNESIRDGAFFHPATHATNADGGGDEAVPYGAHLRLKPDFDVSKIEDPDAEPVVRAMQTYGMFLADGGNIALTAESDARSTAKWADLFESHGLVGIEPSDFELLELGDAIPLTFECARTD